VIEIRQQHVINDDGDVTVLFYTVLYVVVVVVVVFKAGGKRHSPLQASRGALGRAKLGITCRYTI
jgi:hypothetical protein